MHSEVCAASADEVHGVPGLSFGVLYGRGGVDALQEEGHVAAEGAHGLHAFGVECGLAFGSAVDDIPILRRDHGHMLQLEHHGERLQGGCGASAAADGDAGGGLVHREVGTRVEQPLHDGKQGTIGLAVVGGGAHDEGVARGEFLREEVAGVVVEDAASYLAAASAGDAAVNGFCPDAYNLVIDSVFLQGLADLFQCDARVAIGTCASVYQQCFHLISLIICLGSLLSTNWYDSVMSSLMKFSSRRSI